MTEQAQMVTGVLTEEGFVPTETVPVATPKQPKHLNDISDYQLRVLSGKGVENLVVDGILKYAAIDYRKLEAAGVAKNGHIVVETMPRKVNEGMTIPEAKELIAFFEDANISVLLELADIHLKPSTIRRKLGFDW